MKDPNFGDLYKFLVSLGIIIIGFGVVSVWVVITTPIDGIYSTDNYSQLPKNIVLLLENKELFQMWIVRNISHISISMLMIGITLSVFGFIKWRNKQIKIIDKTDELTVKKLEMEIFPASKEQINIKIKEEFADQEIGGIGGGEENITSEELERMAKERETRLIQKYEIDEQFVLKKLIECFDDYVSHRYVKISNVFADLYLESKNTSTKNLIIEIKMLVGFIEPNVLDKILADFYHQSNYYKNNTKLNSIFCLVFIFEESVPNDLYEELIQYKHGYQPDGIIISLISKTELSNSSNNRIRDLILNGIREGVG